MSQKMFYHHNKRILSKILILFLFFSFLMIGCTPKRPNINALAPIYTCPKSLDWKTINPGVSTRQQVIEILGKPAQKGRIKFPDKAISYYGYPIEGGIIAKYAQHRIFFRSDGKVDWIEEIVADSDGDFHTVQETVDQVGATLDTVYNNSDRDWFTEFQYDIIDGPDQIYVWSECGLALLVLRDITRSGPNELAFSPASIDDPQILTLRIPDLFASALPVKDLNRVVMMKFLFQPTNFIGFLELYIYRIPYGPWDEFLKGRSQDN